MIDLFKPKSKEEIEHYLNINNGLNNEFYKIIYETKGANSFSKAIQINCPLDMLIICQDLSEGFLIGPFGGKIHNNILELLKLFDFNATFTNKKRSRIMISQFDELNYNYYIGLQKFKHNIKYPKIVRITPKLVRPTNI